MTQQLLQNVSVGGEEYGSLQSNPVEGVPCVELQQIGRQQPQRLGKQPEEQETEAPSPRQHLEVVQTERQNGQVPNEVLRGYHRVIGDDDKGHGKDAEWQRLAELTEAQA